MFTYKEFLLVSVVRFVDLSYFMFFVLFWVCGFGLEGFKMGGNLLKS